MARADGKSRDAEMQKDMTNRNPSGTGSKRFQASDSSGDSSSRGRGPDGAERNESRSSGQGGAGNPSGAGTSVPTSKERRHDREASGE